MRNLYYLRQFVIVYALLIYYVIMPELYSQRSTTETSIARQQLVKTCFCSNEYEINS
jgi:hypothetical protein